MKFSNSAHSYRLSSPFENNVTAWMVVSEDKETAIVGWYRVLNGINLPYKQNLSPRFKSRFLLSAKY